MVKVKDFAEMFQTAFPQYPLSYHHHNAETPMPLATWEVGEPDDVGGDDGKIQKQNDATLTLWTTNRDFEAENEIEDWLDANDMLCSPIGEYDEESGLFFTHFEFTLER